MVLDQQDILFENLGTAPSTIDQHHYIATIVDSVHGKDHAILNTQSKFAEAIKLYEEGANASGPMSRSDHVG